MELALDSGKAVVARWRDGQPADAALLKAINVAYVLVETPQPDFAAACKSANLIVSSPAEIEKSIIKGGIWPGIRSTGRRRNPDTDVSSASNEPWLDTNLYLVACHRALENRPGILTYTRAQDAENKLIPFESLEIAFAESWLMGGNFVLDVEDRYLRGLRTNDAKAQAAWTKLGRTIAWLKQNSGLHGRPPLPIITALYDGKGGSRELANLLYRRNASPRMAATTPPPSPRIKALVAASIAPPAATEKNAILAHAKAGAVVVVDADWWRDPAAKSLKVDEDREIFSLGKGQVVAYKKRIADPSEFALDVIDLVTHRQRALRLWNANTIVGVATEGKTAGAIVNLINYGTNVPEEVQVQVHGNFTKALMHSPGATPTALKAAKRAAKTEVFVPKLERCCTIEFS